MAKLSTLQFLTGLVMASSAAALCVAPACTVSSGSDGDAGAGGEGNQGGESATGGTSTTGGTSSTGGAPAGGADGEGGTTGDAGASAGGAGGNVSGGGATGDAGAAGAAGASGKVCMAPTAEQVTAKGDSCAVYCASYLSTCADYNASDSTFADEAECLRICELFDDAQLCCRAYHVRNAAVSASAATTHCQHAAGNSVCN